MLTAGYLATLGFGAAQASVPAQSQPLAGWLAAHGLTRGLASYWQANSTTVAGSSPATIRQNRQSGSDTSISLISGGKSTAH